jgi:catechol 2,3-dioxygenase-like lactoylglutathione lyase family enzyme
MLSAVDHLALEVKYLDRARAFYERTLGVAPARVTDEEVAYPVGGAELVVRRPGPVPRGGLHVHFAASTAPDALDGWQRRLAAFEPVEVSFGQYRSVYVDDPDDHCVEVGSNGSGPGLTGLFEVVLEVESLAGAKPRFRALGFDVVDRGSDRRRVRLRGPLDVELWEPQLGLADARGGVHVDLGFTAPDPGAAADALAEWTTDRVALGDGGVRVRDPDGHWLAFHPADA